jgi:hypothetical protein
MRPSVHCADGLFSSLYIIETKNLTLGEKMCNNEHCKNKKCTCDPCECAEEYCCVSLTKGSYWNKDTQAWDEIE